MSRAGIGVRGPHADKDACSCTCGAVVGSYRRSVYEDALMVPGGLRMACTRHLPMRCAHWTLEARAHMENERFGPTRSRTGTVDSSQYQRQYHYDVPVSAATWQRAMWHNVSRQSLCQWPIHALQRRTVAHLLRVRYSTNVIRISYHKLETY